MSTDNLECQRYCFGSFTLDPRSFRLTKGPDELTLTPKAFELLTLLVRERHRVLTKQELLDAVWPDTAVIENTLTQRIKEIREALGDSAHESTYIRTVPRVGFQFIADTSMESAAPPVPDAPAVPAPSEQTTPPVVRDAATEPAAAGWRAVREVTATVETQNAPQTMATRRRPAFRASHALVAAAVVTLGAGLLWWWQRDRPLQLGEQRLIAASVAPRRTPSYSPDGASVSYVAPDSAGVQQIWVQSLAGGTPLQITNGKSSASRPRWLPGSNQILFARASEGLWTVPATGGTPTRLIERGTNPNVSRDGRRIVFEDQRTLWTAAPDGSQVERVGGVVSPAYQLPMMPALSPDGSTIAYFSAALGPNGDFWTIPAAGGTPRRLTADLREGGWPVWTVDGDAVIVSSARAGSRILWQIPVNGGEPVPLTMGAGEDDQPELSADGRQLAYTNTQHRWELRVRDLASGTERTLVQRGLELLFPIFSPDGTRIVYFGRSDYAVAIFTINADGSDLRQLTAGRELNHQPRWSHDGEHIYFFQHSPTVSFRRMPSLGGPSAEFRDWNWETTTAPSFDPTGSRIAYLRQRAPGAPTSVTEHTVIHDVATGQERVWPEPHTHIGGWSPDGASIVGIQHAPGGGTVVAVCRVAEESCRPLTRGLVAKWSPDGSRIYFVRAAAGGSHQLWTMTAEGADEQQVADLGSFRPIDVFIDVSRTGLVAWAPMIAGQPQLWTATVK
jgi:Tol biopolymer transport system component/DNA-binding winged helix-turn-helix (wHTH) protein